MAISDVSQREIKKVYKTRNLDLYLIIMMFMMMFLLPHIQNTFQAILWYVVFIIMVFQHSHVQAWLLDKKRKFLRLMDYGIDDIFLPIVIWGVGMFFVLLFFYKGMGAEFHWATLEVGFFQLLVASAETFIFCIFLVDALPETWGTIPFTKTRIPNWFWGAGVWFGTFHFFAYWTGDFVQTGFKMVFAIFMGIVFYKIYAYGDVNKNIGGASGTIALHTVWNYMSLSVSLTIIPEVFNIFRPL